MYKVGGGALMPILHQFTLLPILCYDIEEGRVLLGTDNGIER